MKAAEFLQLLWGDQPSGLIQLWTLSDKRSTYLRNPVGAGVIANGRPDVYTGVALSGQDYGRNRRCKASDTVALAGLWLDLDVNGGPEDKQGVAPSSDAALALAHQHLEPTLVVNSGYGLHAWWLFEKPWRFATPAERDRAAYGSAQWYELHRRDAKRDGWTIDGTHDLARLLRLPGTINGKGGLRASVSVVKTSDRRYSVDELLERAASVGPIGLVAAVDGVEIKPGGTIKNEQLEQLATSHVFARTWEHARSEHPDWTLSEYDLALCSIAARLGWTDQQLADLITTHRVKYGDVSKAGRLDYLQRTIAKVRESQNEQGTEPDAERAETRVTFTAQEWADHILDMLERTDEGAIPVPWAELNQALDGGLRPGELCLVAGYTSHGKSIVVDQMADTAAQHGRRVHIYMTEMTAYQRGLRLLARKSGVPFRTLKRRGLGKAEWAAVMDELRQLPYGCSIVSDWSIEQVVEHIRRERWDLAVIDLIHGFHYHDERDLSKTSSALARAAKGSSTEHRGTAVIAAAHLNDGQMRDVRSPKRPKPGLHSIKGSSSLKQDADVVMFVWQEDDEQGMPTGEGAIWIAKCRQGELGGVKVTLNPVRMRFELTGGDWLREAAA